MLMNTWQFHLLNYARDDSDVGHFLHKKQWHISFFWERSSGFDLMTRNSYFTILVEVFPNHILVENIFHESCRVNRTQDYGLKICKQIPDYSALLWFWKHSEVLFTCAKILRKLLRRFTVFIHSFSYKKNLYMWFPLWSMYLRVYEHSYVFTENCFWTKKVVRSLYDSVRKT